MKTLKKAICLILAVSMMLSLCVMTASASEFNDDDEINYKEAVDVMSGIGIIAGRPNGSFDPQGSFTRAEACKILAYMLAGKSASAMDDPDPSVQFSDCKGHWASGYIAYIASLGIINGVGGGKFAPDATLSNYAWIKMLLGAVGADTSALTGPAWEINTVNAALAFDEGELYEYDDVSMTFNREAAVQLAFKAMTYAPKKDWEWKVDVKSASGTRTLGPYKTRDDAIDAATLWLLSRDEYEFENVYAVKDTKDSLMTSKYNAYVVFDSDNYGIHNERWYIDVNKNEKYDKNRDTNLCDWSQLDKVVAEYSNTVTSSKMYNDLDLDKKLEDVPVYINGQSLDDSKGNMFTFDLIKGSTAKLSEEIAAYDTAANGRGNEKYPNIDSSSMSAKLVKLDEKIGDIEYWIVVRYEQTAQVDRGARNRTATSEDYGKYNYIFNLCEGGRTLTGSDYTWNKNVQKYYEDGTFKDEGFYNIVVFYDGATIKEIEYEPARTVVGQVDRVSKASVTIDGIEYAQTGDLHQKNIFNPGDGKEYTFIFNTNDEVVYAFEGREGTEVHDGTAYLYSAQYNNSNSVFGSDDSTLVAKVGMVDIDNNKMAVDIATRARGFNLQYKWGGAWYDAESGTKDVKNFTPGWYYYDVDEDGIYSFKPISNETVVATTANKKAIAIGGTTYTVTSRTVITIASYDGSTRTVSTKVVNGSSAINASIVKDLNSAVAVDKDVNGSALNSLTVFKSANEKTNKHYAVYTGKIGGLSYEEDVNGTRYQGQLHGFMVINEDGEAEELAFFAPNASSDGKYSGAFNEGSYAIGELMYIEYNENDFLTNASHHLNVLTEWKDVVIKDVYYEDDGSVWFTTTDGRTFDLASNCPVFGDYDNDYFDAIELEETMRINFFVDKNEADEDIDEVKIIVLQGYGAKTNH